MFHVKHFRLIFVLEGRETLPLIGLSSNASIQCTGGMECRMFHVKHF